MKNTVAYVYKWIHIPSGMWYIGSKSANGCHPDNHEKYICSKPEVKESILKNREEWIFEIWDTGDPLEIRKLESKYLRLLNAKNNPTSFNESNAGWDPGNRLGRKESIETRQKKSEARQGEKNPMYGKTGELSPHYGKKYSDERKLKQSISVKKYASNRPDSHNENIKKSLLGNPKLGHKGEKNGMYGKSPSDYNKRMSTLKNSGDGNPMKKPEHQRFCEFCCKTVAKNHYTMYHGSKCKNNPEKLINYKND